MMSIPHLIYRLRYLLAFIAILACIGTWYMDLQGMVYHCPYCPYCRVQRTMIGLLGLILFLPGRCFPTLQRITAFIIGFFGIDIAGDQMFLSIKAGTFPTINFGFALSAMVLIVLLWISIFQNTVRA